MRFFEDTGTGMPEPQGEGGDIKGQGESDLAPSVD